MKLGTQSLVICLGMVLFSTGALADVNYGLGGPNEGGYGDCTPGCTAQYQQLFSGSFFSSPTYITGIELYYLAGDASTFTFNLSTSPATVSGGLSNTFADNVGADNQLFYTGPLVASDSITHIALFTGTPFYYDPSLGDLLLYIHHSSGFTSNSNSDAVSPSTGLFDRVYNFNDVASGFGSQEYGNVTTFLTSSVVPEPSSFAFLGAALGGLVIGIRRRRCT